MRTWVWLACLMAGGVLPLITAAPVGAQRADVDERTWIRRLPEYLPEIGACLQVAPGSARLITLAWPIDPQQNLVGVRGTDGASVRWECVANKSGTLVRDFRMLDPGTRMMPGECDPVFVPAPQLGAGNGCTAVETAEVSDRVVGWTIRNTCR